MIHFMLNIYYSLEFVLSSQNASVSGFKRSICKEEKISVLTADYNVCTKQIALIQKQKQPAAITIASPNI